MATIYRVRTIFTGVAGSPYYSNLYFDASTGSGQAAVNATSTFFFGMRTVISNDLEYNTEPDVAVLDDATGQIIGSDTTSPGFGEGQNIGEILPLATQGLISFTTGVYSGGRQIRGRTFIPGPVLDASEGGAPTLAYRSVLQASADALLADVDSQLVIFSPTKLTSATVTNAATFAKWAVQRSRRD